MTGRLGERLFEFAVLTDSHVNAAESRSVSPYRSNRRANARFRYVVRAIRLNAPAFALHLGDMANPLPELSGFDAAVASFRQIAGELGVPLHLVAGNHCLGDKPRGWVPVPRVSEAALAQYRRAFGPPFYAFDHGPCHFAVLASLLVESGFAVEEEQRQWIEADLEAAHRRGQRLWLAMHYPPFIASPDEPGSYDNLDPPGRAWVLSLLERWPVEAVLSGHVHNYFYNHHAGAPLYTVPATSFVRQDYGELYRVAPRDREGGRDDRDKLGWFRVRVYEQGHTVHLVRSHGRELSEDESLEDEARRLEPVSAREAGAWPVTVEVRDNWLAPVSLRPNNSVSPFTRRWARNDWPIAALEEMGVARIRLALQELAQPGVPGRMKALASAGFGFVVYSHGPPDASEIEAIRERHAPVAAWELILRLEDVEGVARNLAASGGGGSANELPPLYLNRVLDIRRGEIDDANVRHVANYGFQPADWERLEELCRSEPIATTFRGLVFRIRRRGRPEISPWKAIHEIGRLARATGMRHQAHILFSGNVTAQRFLHDPDTARRVAESALAAVVVGDVDVCLDTFEDVDRGYFVRHGLVDRRYNPRLAARVLGHLHAALCAFGSLELVEWGAREVNGARLLCGRCGVRRVDLILPRRPITLEEVWAPGEIPAAQFTLIDLDQGRVRDIPSSGAGAPIGATPVETPHLVIAGPRAAPGLSSLREHASNQ